MSLKECVSHWYYMLNPFEIKDCNYDDKDIIMWLDRLVRLDFPTFDPLLIIILSSFKKEDTQYIVELLNQMERFYFWCYVYLKERLIRETLNFMDMPKNIKMVKFQ